MFVYTISKKGETIGSGQVLIRRHTSKFIDLIEKNRVKNSNGILIQILLYSKSIVYYVNWIFKKKQRLVYWVLLWDPYVLRNYKKKLLWKIRSLKIKTFQKINDLKNSFEHFLFSYLPNYVYLCSNVCTFSMTSLLSHTVAYSTRRSFGSKTNNQHIKKCFSLAVSWVKVVKN